MREHTTYLDSKLDDYGQVLALFEDMSTYHLPGKLNQAVYVDRCHQLGVPVFFIDGEQRAFYESDRSAFFPSRKPGCLRICVSSRIENFGGFSLEEVVDRLFYGSEPPDAFALHHYSRNRDLEQWGPFDEVEDRPKIIQALEKWKADIANHTAGA